MIGLVLVTHGGIGQALRDALEHVVGPQAQLATVPVGANDDMQTMRAAIDRALLEVDNGDGAVLLTDMFGGTPSNLAISMLEDHAGIEVISGANLPMLVKLAKVRGDHTFAECVEYAQMAGRKYIAAASALPSACLGGSACVGLISGRKVEPALPVPLVRASDKRLAGTVGA